MVLPLPPPMPASCEELGQGGDHQTRDFSSRPTTKVRIRRVHGGVKRKQKGADLDYLEARTALVNLTDRGASVHRKGLSWQVRSSKPRTCQRKVWPFPAHGRSPPSSWGSPWLTLPQLSHRTAGRIKCCLHKPTGRGPREACVFSLLSSAPSAFYLC